MEAVRTYALICATGTIAAGRLKISIKTGKEMKDMTRSMTEKDGLISVIVPVYNVEEYLPQCLDSICTQTYKDLEIILVDDGSTDSSGAICDQWAEKDPRIRVIHKKNGGVSAARNEGLKAATGALIGFVDSDDWVEPDMYEKMKKRMGSADVVMSGFFDYPYGMDCQAIPRGIRAVRPCGYEGAVLQIMSRDCYYCTLWNKLYRMKAVKKGGRLIQFDTALDFGEDEIWLLQVLKNSKKITFLPEPLYHWRRREGSITRFDRVSEKQMSLLEAKKQSFRLMPNTRAARSLAKSKMFNDCFFMRIRAYCTKDWEHYRKITEKLAPLWRTWLAHKDTPLLRKIKVLVIMAEMKLNLPGPLVEFTDNIKKMHR